MSIQNQKASNENLFEVVQKGTRYEPASEHYKNTHPAGTLVRCDNCGAEKLNVCVGFDSLDLCVACNNKLASELESAGKQVYTDCYNCSGMRTRRSCGFPMMGCELCKAHGNGSGKLLVEYRNKIVDVTYKT